MSTFYSPFSHPFAKPISRAKNVPLVLLGEAPISGDWILATGFWVDTNVWNDSESWID